MKHSIPKKWRYLCWTGGVLTMACILLGYIGYLLGGTRSVLSVGLLLSLAGLALTAVCSLKLRCPSCGSPLSQEALRLVDTFYCARCGVRIDVK